MNYEVEVKFPVPENIRLKELITGLGATPLETRRQEDRYFNHPARDFARTDESLRLRVDGDQNRMTYKGPKVDQVTKTRKEIEVTYQDGSVPYEHMVDLLKCLGFVEVRRVTKRRETYEVNWQGLEIEISIDDVDDLGVYVEIEALAPEGSVDDVRKKVLGLAAELGFAESERRSYLEMLLAKDGR